MQFGSFHSWVFYLGKDAFKVSQFNFFHPIVSDFLDPILSLPHNLFFRGWGYLDAIALLVIDRPRYSTTAMWYSYRESLVCDDSRRRRLLETASRGEQDACQLTPFAKANSGFTR